VPSTSFRGWPAEALAFYRGLEVDNSKAYWTAHKASYDDDVRRPMTELCAELEGDYGSFHVFRPNRDVRFSRDKSPYKTAIGAVTEGTGGEAYYVQISAEGLFAASGYYHLAVDQLARYRVAVDDTRSGRALERALADVSRQGYQISGQSLKTSPRGFARDHPRVELLRHKGVTVGRSYPPARWLSTSACLTHITDVWSAAATVNRWLNRHVGPSTAPPFGSI
jgi:uncharacterized protein (TIGR02453 family)